MGLLLLPQTVAGTHVYLKSLFNAFPDFIKEKKNIVSFSVQLQHPCGSGFTATDLHERVTRVIVRVMPDDILMLSHSHSDFSDELGLSNALQYGCEPDINIIWFVSRPCEPED